MKIQHPIFQTDFSLLLAPKLVVVDVSSDGGCPECEHIVECIVGYIYVDMNPQLWFALEDLVHNYLVECSSCEIIILWECLKEGECPE